MAMVQTTTNHHGTPFSMNVVQTTTDHTVSITKSILVSPPNIGDSSDVLKSITLSNLDTQCRIFVYQVFFYKQRDFSSFDSIFNHLKDSLEETLSIWYPAAGRLDHGEKNILCNGAGATLIQATTPINMSDLGKNGVYTYSNFFEKLVFRPDDDRKKDITEMPLFTAQVTRFECGGYSIGVGMSHTFFDAMTAYNFLCAWAALSHSHQHKNNGNNNCVHRQHEPSFHKGELSFLLSENSTDHHNRVQTGVHDLYELVRQSMETPTTHQMYQESEIVFPTFHITTAMIQKLKNKVFEVEDTHKENNGCSSSEILAAHMWKSRTKAMGFAKDRKVCLQIVVDVRDRMVPTLPKGYSGNAYVVASVLLSVGELLNQTLEYTINQIKEAKKSVTHDHVRAFVNALESAQHQQEDTIVPPLTELTIVTDWTRTPFHKIEFFGGEFVYNSPIVPPLFPQLVYFIQNPIHPMDIDVKIRLPPAIKEVFSHNFTADL